MRRIAVFTPAWTKFMWHREPRVCIWIRDETHPYFFLYDHALDRAWNCMPDVAREPTLLQRDMDATSGIGPATFLFFSFLFLPFLSSPYTWLFLFFLFIAVRLPRDSGRVASLRLLTRPLQYSFRTLFLTLLSPTRGLEASGIMDWNCRVKLTLGTRFAASLDLAAVAALIHRGWCNATRFGYARLSLEIWMNEEEDTCERNYESDNLVDGTTIK